MELRLSLLSLTTFCLFMLSACRQDPIGTTQDASNIVTSPAHPALTYYGAFKGFGGTYSAIYVADSDCSHQTPIAIASSHVVQFDYLPSWSPDGGSICFTQDGMSMVPDTLKALTLSQNIGTAPSGIRMRTILGLPDTSTHILNTFWSSTEGMGKIVYPMSSATGNKLFVISENGGTPRELWSGPISQGIEFCTWSPDDSRLACCRWNQFSDYSIIMIFNTADWSYVDSISVNGYVGGLTWSRNGMNKLAFGVVTALSRPFFLYYCDPKTGATPTTDGVAGCCPTWSPDNSSLLCYANNGLSKVTPFTRRSTLVAPTFGTPVIWKR